MTLTEQSDGDGTQTPQVTDRFPPLGDGSNTQSLAKKGGKRVGFEDDPSLMEYSGSVGLPPRRDDADSRSREITQIAEEVAAGTVRRVIDQLEAIVTRELDRRGVGRLGVQATETGGQYQPAPAGGRDPRRVDDYFYPDDGQMDYAPPPAGRGRRGPLNAGGRPPIGEPLDNQGFDYWQMEEPRFEPPMARPRPRPGQPRGPAPPPWDAGRQPRFQQAGPQWNAPPPRQNPVPEWQQPNYMPPPSNRM